MNSLIAKAAIDWLLRAIAEWLDGLQQTRVTQRHVDPRVRTSHRTPKYPNSTKPGTWNRDEGRWN